MVGCIKQSIVTILLLVRNRRGDERATSGDISDTALRLRAHGCEWLLRVASGILSAKVVKIGTELFGQIRTLELRNSARFVQTAHFHKVQLTR